MARVWYAAHIPGLSQHTDGGDGVLQLRLSRRLFVGAFARSSRRVGSSPLPSPLAAVAGDAAEGLHRRKIPMFTLAYRLCLVYEGSRKTLHCVLQLTAGLALCVAVLLLPVLLLLLLSRLLHASVAAAAAAEAAVITICLGWRSRR